MLGSIIDVTNLRKAQAEVSSNIEQKRFLAEAMPLIVWVVEADGKISFINKQFSLYTGIETEGLTWIWSSLRSCILMTLRK